MVGNYRKFISALIVPNFEALRLLAEYQELKVKSDAELIKLPEVIDFFQQTIEQL